MLFKKFEYKDQYHYPTFVMLNVTDNCNLACRYCFVEQHPHYMSFDIAKKAVDWEINNYKIKRQLNLADAQEKCELNFFGGEPTLMFDQIIIPLVEYVEDKYPDMLNFGMTTNCTLLTKDKVDFCYEHNIHILASIDGAEETQCYNRPCRNGANSSKMVEENVKYLLEKFPNTVFRSTGYAPTIHHLYENYLYAESLGFRQWVIIPDERIPWTDEQINTFEEQLSKIYLYKLQKQLSGLPYTQVSSADSFQKGMNVIIKKEIRKEKKCPLRCGLGTLGCAIGWDGKIYACQQDVSFDKKNIMFIGDINEGGIDPIKHKKLLKKFVNTNAKYPYKKKECKNCMLRECCSNIGLCGCVSTSLELFNNFGKVSKIHCRFNQMMFKEQLLSDSILVYFNEGERRNE